MPRLDAVAIESVLREVLVTGRPAVDVEYHGRTRAEPDREHAYSTSFFRLEDDSGAVRGFATWFSTSPTDGVPGSISHC